MFLDDPPGQAQAQPRPGCSAAGERYEQPRQHFRGDARLSTWIYRVVQNVCFQARPRRQLLSLDDDRDDRPRIDPGRADAAFADMELRDRLEKAIAQLPEQYRVLIAAHYLDGVQYESLAEAMNLPLGTVKTHLYRAKRRLRELLNP